MRKIIIIIIIIIIDVCVSDLVNIVVYFCIFGCNEYLQLRSSKSFCFVID